MTNFYPEYTDDISSKIICLDIETGGLEPRDPIIEIAYAPVNEEPVTLFLAHDTFQVSDWTKNNTGYFERGLDNPDKWCSKDDILDLHDRLTGVTIMGSNPRFDILRVSALFGNTMKMEKGASGMDHLVEPWAYRLIDVAGIGSFLFGAHTTIGLHQITEELIKRGYDIPRPDHTAAQDVRSTWACYKALKDLQRRMIASLAPA